MVPLASRMEMARKLEEARVVKAVSPIQQSPDDVPHSFYLVLIILLVRSRVVALSKSFILSRPSVPLFPAF
jgi:hypothetical protein